ncbi:MAG: hypothetical protein WDZ30_01765 [Cellvibrionaceae bacterium]
MTDNWRAYLTDQGAQWDQQGVRGFDSGPSRERDAQLFALGHLGYLTVTGPEARKFLQGQVTCDMSLVTIDHSQPGAHCNTKGRMVFSFQAVQLAISSPESDSFALIMHRGLLQRAREALAKFIVFSRAELSSEQGHNLIGLAGARSLPLLPELLPRIPIAKHDVVQADGSLGVRVNGDRFLCLVNGGESAPALWRAWAEHCSLRGYPDWNLANIRDGLGEVVPGCEELFIPQMLNMQVTGGVSFNKGCYIGQEVVARMQYLGKLKRHMRRAQVNMAEAPPPGSPVYAQESAQSVGNIVLTAPAADNTIELLAVTTDSAFDSDALFADPQRTQKLHLLPLPYVITK